MALAVLAFAADAGAFAALAARTSEWRALALRQAQAGLQHAAGHGVAEVVTAAHDEGADRPELRFDRVGLVSRF